MTSHENRALELLNERVKALVNRISELEQSRDAQRQSIAHLEERLRTLEEGVRRRSLPEAFGEQ